MVKRYLYAILYLLSPIIPVILIHLSYQHKSNISHEIASILGAIAYTWIIGQLVMAARPNFIIKYFWDDEYYDFHKFMGAMILIVSIAHGLFEMKIGLIKVLISKFGYLIIVLFAFFIIMSFIFMVEEGALLKISFINKFKENFQKHKIFQYENIIKIHSILAIVAAVLLYHVLLSRANYMIKLVYEIYFATGFISYSVFKVKKFIRKANNAY